jgi:thymidylate synthase
MSNLFFTGDTYSTFHAAYRKIIYEVLRKGGSVPSRVGETRELLNFTFSIDDPRDRLIGYPSRKADYGFAVGEFLWYARGADDLESMLYYNRRMGDFSDDGKTLNSAYGKRIFNTLHEVPGYPGSFYVQWDGIRQELRLNPDSRRAVITIMNAMDVGKAISCGTKDVPCTLSLQFLIRDGRLDMIVNMRSNDVIWGLTYDVFSFTLLQEMMAMELGVKLGRYHHHAGSMHIYSRHFEMCERILQESVDNMSASSMGTPLEPGQMALLLEFEHTIRVFPGDIDGGENWRNCWHHLKYLPQPSSARWMAEELVKHKRKRDAQRREEQK